MAGLRVVDVVPKDRRMVALDEFPHLRVSVLAISLALRLHRFIISWTTDRTGDKCPVVAARVVEAHAQTLFVDSSGQLADEIARGVLPIGRQFGVWRRTGPQRKPFMMLTREHHIFCAGVVEDFRPDIGLPLLYLTVEDGSEVVVIIVSAIVLAMVSLRRRSIESHRVQVPFSVGIVFDVVL